MQALGGDFRPARVDTRYKCPLGTYLHVSELISNMLEINATNAHVDALTHRRTNAQMDPPS